MLTLSAHKIGGPKGVGAVFVRRGLSLHPLVAGGHQERERRAGTENVVGIAGFGVACRLAQVERELDLLRARGVRNVFFIDDNLIGHLPRCRELLDFLADYQRRHRYRFTFGAEVSANVAAPPGLLELFRRARFQWVFIGLETPSRQALATS